MQTGTEYGGKKKAGDGAFAVPPTIAALIERLPDVSSGVHYTVRGVCREATRYGGRVPSMHKGLGRAERGRERRTQEGARKGIERTRKGADEAGPYSPSSGVWVRSWRRAR